MLGILPHLRGSSPCFIFPKFPSNHQFDAPAEEEEVEAVTEHAHGGEDVLQVSETEQSGGHHQ